MHRIKQLAFSVTKDALLIRISAIALSTVILMLMLTQTAFAQNTYVITDGSKVLVHTTYATDPADVLNEAGLELGKDDTFIAHPGDGVSEITIHRGQTVSIQYCGKTIQADTNGESVRDLLDRLNISTSGNTTVSVPLDSATYDGMALSISRTIRAVESFTSIVPYETVYREDDTIPAGTEYVLSRGVNGETQCLASVTYIDGTESSRKILSERVITVPQAQIVLVGTAELTGEADSDTSWIPDETVLAAAEIEPPAPEDAVLEAGADPVLTIGDGYIITESGEVLTYSDTVSVLATAYTCEGWSSVGITATGTVARVGEIAVDPDVIPLGSRLFIVSDDGEYVYGVATAEDTGGLIIGHRIDLYYDTEAECWEFGARNCTVYFLT